MYASAEGGRPEQAVRMAASEGWMVGGMVGGEMGEGVRVAAWAVELWAVRVVVRGRIRVAATGTEMVEAAAAAVERGRIGVAEAASPLSQHPRCRSREMVR